MYTSPARPCPICPLVSSAGRLGGANRNIKLLYGFSFFDQFMIVIALWIPYLATKGIAMQQFMELEAVFALVILGLPAPTARLRGKGETNF